jgi:hypothetical protein
VATKNNNKFLHINTEILVPELGTCSSVDRPEKEPQKIQPQTQGTPPHQ